MMKQADIEDVLLSVGPFTLFAPSDDSFTFLPGAVWQSFRKDIEKKRDFLMHHVVPGTVNSANVKNDLVINAARGPPVRCNLYNGGKDWTVSGAQVIQPDNRHGEYTVHIIDDFLYPPATMNNLDYIRANFDNFHRMLAMGDPNNYISEGTFTVFVPGDEAFKALPEFLVESIFTNNSLLQSVLLNHIVPSTYYQIGLPLGNTLTSLDNNQLRFKTRRGMVMVNGVPIVRPDISVTNGVIHIVNRVILPPNVFEDCNCLPTTPYARTTPQPQTTTPVVETVKTTSITAKQTRTTPKSIAQRKQRTTPISFETAVQTTEVPLTTESNYRARRPSYAPLTLPSFESSRLKPTKATPKSKTTTPKPPADVEPTCEDENSCSDSPCPDGKECPSNDQTNLPLEPNQEQVLEQNDETQVPESSSSESSVYDTQKEAESNEEPPVKDANEPEQNDDPNSESYPQDEPVCNDKDSCKKDKTQDVKTTPRPTQKDKNICPGPNCPKECAGKDCEEAEPLKPDLKKGNDQTTPCSPGVSCPESEGKEPSKRDKPAESLCPFGKFCPDVETVQIIDCPEGSDCSLQKPKPSDCLGKSCPEINKAQPQPNDQKLNNNYDKCNGGPCPSKPTPRYQTPKPKPNFVPAGRRKPTVKPPGFIRIPYGPLLPKPNSTSTTPSEGNTIVTSPEVVIISRATSKAPLIPESDSQLTSLTKKEENPSPTTETYTPAETTKPSTDLTSKQEEETTISTLSSTANQKQATSSVAPEFMEMFTTSSSTPNSEDINSRKITSANTEKVTQSSNTVETPEETVPTTTQPETSEVTTEAAQTSPLDGTSDPTKPNSSPDIQSTEPPNASTKLPSTSTTFETKGPFDFSDDDSLVTNPPTVLETTEPTTEQSVEETTTSTFPSQEITPDKTADTPVSNSPTVTQSQKTKSETNPNSDPTVPSNLSISNSPLTSSPTATSTEVHMQTTSDLTTPDLNTLTPDPSTLSTTKNTMPLTQNDPTEASEKTQQPTEISTKMTLPVKNLQENTQSLSDKTTDVYKSSETVPQETTVPVSSMTQEKETTANANNSDQDKSTTQAESPPPCSNSQKTTDSNPDSEVTKEVSVTKPEDNPDSSSTLQVTTLNNAETQRPNPTVQPDNVDPTTPSTTEFPTSKRIARTTSAPELDPNSPSPDLPESTVLITTQEIIQETTNPAAEITEESTPIISTSENSKETTPVTDSEPTKPVSTSQDLTQISTRSSEEEITTQGIAGRRPIRQNTTPSVEDTPVNDEGAPDNSQNTEPSTNKNEITKSSTTTRPRPSIVIIPYVTTPQPSSIPQETSAELETTTEEKSATTPQNELDKQEPSNPTELTNPPHPPTQAQTTEDNSLYTETTSPSSIPPQPEYQPSKPEVEELTPEFLDPPNSIDDVLNRPNLVIGRTRVTFHVVLKLFKNIGLTDILLRKGPYTLCVPTDAAFSRLPAGYLQRVQGNGDLLRKILLHHVITSQVPVSSLRNNYVIRTYQGQPVIINVHNAGKLVLFGGAQVLGTTRTRNGVLYIVDRVLSDVPQYNLLRAIRNNPELEHFYDYVMNSPLKQILRARGPFTVVAPTNDAFSQLSPGVLNMLTTNQTALEKVVYNHLVPGAYFSAGLYNGLVLPTPRDGTLRFTITTDGLHVNDARVLHPDISAGNGVLHVVDQVLLSSPEIFEKLSQANNPIAPSSPTSPLHLSELTTGLGVDTFIKWLGNSELLEKISNGERYTILAPTDHAVQALPPTTLRSLNENPKMLLQVLKYHVVPGFLQPTVISNEDTLPTLLPGKDVRFNWYKNETDLLVSGARLGLDRRRGQIVIQVINKVLYPPTGDIMNTISKSPLLRDLARAVRMTGLEKELTDSSRPCTLFAPTQEAFRNMPRSEYNRIFSSPEEMKYLLMRHLSVGTLFSTGVSNGMIIPSRNGENITITIKPQCIVVDGINVLYSDITATNGVVHVLNHLL